MTMRDAFWESWKALQEELKQARAEGCALPVHFQAASAAWEQSANMSLRIPAPWVEAREVVEDGRRYLRYR